MPWWKIAAAATLVFLTGSIAFAQDRPLLEPLRIGFAQAEPTISGLRNSPTLEHALRRKGYVPVWREFPDGLATVRSLDAEIVDLALNIPLTDVIAARRENLKMVFIAELRSIVPSCCELEQAYADHMFKRYTLSNEYLADYREDILLIVHQEIIKVLQSPPEYDAFSLDNPETTSSARNDRRNLPRVDRVRPVTPTSMREAHGMVRERSPDGQSNDTRDLAPINYWMPGNY